MERMGSPTYPLWPFSPLTFPMASLSNLLPTTLGAALSPSSSWSRPCCPCAVVTSNFARYEICRTRNSNARRIRIVTHSRNGADPDGNSVDTHGQDPTGFIPWRLGLQTFIVVFTFGFIDAGYSGDWSRIGVLSPEAESMLRLASYGVVPVCLALVWRISKEKGVQKR